MGILIDKNTRVVIQGITGKEGSKATREMLDYGTVISCGVTPGKSGSTVEGLPVFDGVKEAIEYDPRINTSVIYVPPLMVFDAAVEAIRNGIKTVLIFTENVPSKDSAKLVDYASRNNARVIGPSSIGLINVGVGKLGSIGGSKEQDMYSKGKIGIISKSGGMCAETALLLTKEGLGQSTVIGIGGDLIIGSTFTDLLELFGKDSETDAVVIYGEIGTSYELNVAEFLKKNKDFKKPIIAFIAGQFAQSIDRQVSFGHAGAIIENGHETAEAKKNALREAGAYVANYHDEIPSLVKQALNKSGK